MPVEKDPIWWRALERFGVSTVVLGVVLYVVVYKFLPIHDEFLHTIAGQQIKQTEVQGKQTEVVEALKETAEKSFTNQALSSGRLENLVEAIGDGDRKKLESLELLETKVDRVHSNTEEIKNRLPKAGDG